MKSFNINHHMYIQITELGWKHLEKTVGIEYINACIKTPHYTRTINGEVWYRLQAHQVIELLNEGSGLNVLFKTEVMFDDDELIDAPN